MRNMTVYFSLESDEITELMYVSNNVSVMISQNAIGLILPCLLSSASLCTVDVDSLGRSIVRTRGDPLLEFGMSGLCQRIIQLLAHREIIP